MSQAESLSVGSKVVFTGFTGDSLPDHSELLTEGDEYSIVETKQESDDAEVVYLLEVDNPDFDSKKRKSKKNVATLMIDVFADEIRLADVTDDGTAETEGETGEGADDGAEVLDYADVKRGMEVTAYDGDDRIGAGKVTSKTKKGVKIENEDGEVVLASPDCQFYDGIYEDPDDMGETSPEEDPELKNMLILTEDEEDQEILDIVQDADDLCVLAQEMSEESASLDYRLGGVLYHVRVSGAYKDLDERYAAKGGFMLYVEEKLPVGYRKAMYLIDIYAKWNKFNFPMEKVQEIGWTKAQAIAAVMNEDNAEELVELAEGNTVAEIKDTIKDSYSGGTTPREVVKKIKFTFRLTEDAAANVREFFEEAKTAMDLEKDEQVFENIVTQWATDHLDIKKVGRNKTAAKKTAKKTVAKKATAKKATAKAG